MFLFVVKIALYCTTVVASSSISFPRPFLSPYWLHSFDLTGALPLVYTEDSEGRKQEEKNKE